MPYTGRDLSRLAPTPLGLELLQKGTQAAAREVLGAQQAIEGGFNFRNKIINGNFDVWQRGTSQTTNGYGSDDRWSNQHTGSTKTASRQPFAVGQTDVPGNPKFFSRTVVSSVSGADNFVSKDQKIEDVRTLAGKTVTLSFYAKSDAPKQLAIELLQSFGSGGSPSTTVTGIGAQKFSLTTVWQKFSVVIAIPSISGKTIGSNDDSSLIPRFYFDAGSNFNSRTASLGHQSGTFDIAQVQLEEGSVATPFEQRPIGVELMLCQRYYETFLYRWDGYNVAGGLSGTSYGFKTEKRAAPSITLTNPGYNNANSVLSVSITTASVGVRATTTAAGFSQFSAEVQASAEL